MTDTINTTPGPEIDVTALQRRLRRESLMFASIFALVLFGLSLVLIAWRTEQLLTQLEQDRTVRLLRQVADEAESGLRFGVSVADQTVLPERITRLGAAGSPLRGVFIDTDRGEAVLRSGDAALHTTIAPRWRQAVIDAGPGHAPVVRNTGRYAWIGAAIFDSTGAPAATLWGALDPAEVRAQARGVALDMVLRALPLMLLALVITWWLLLRWSTRVMTSMRGIGHGNGAQATPNSARKLWLAVVFSVLVAPAAMLWIAREAARPAVTAQIQENADAVGRALSAQVARALSLGVPWTAMNGVDELFRQQLVEAPELSYLALQPPGGPAQNSTWGSDVPSQARDSASDFPRRTLKAGDGAVVVGYPVDFVDRQLAGMLIDLVLALVIAAVLVRELARGLWRRSLLFPLAAYVQARLWQGLQRRWQKKHAIDQESAQAHDRDADECRAQLIRAARSDGATAEAPQVGAQLTLLRLTVFLVALSEELLRPFFTVFASEVRPIDAALSPTMVAGLPVAAFMATLALAQPAGPALARRFDLRWSLMLAALAGTLALAATAWATDAWTLIGLRALGGAAYGLALILVQTAIVRITPPQQRARGLAEVAAAIVAAGIVGPPFGGMIAARAGDGIGFLACALCMVGALLAALRLSLPVPEGSAAAQRGLATSGGWRGYMAVLREPRAIWVILGAALPGRLVAVTILSVVVPLYMNELQQPPAVAGRVLLLYFLCFALSASLVAHWSDLLGQRKPFIVAGGVFSVLACLSLPALGGVWGMAACCALLGLGQALQSSPQIALTTEAFEGVDASRATATPEQALAAFRLIERGGSIVAPFVTAVAVTAFGYAGAVVAVGLLLSVTTLSLAAGLRNPRIQAATAA